MRVVFDHAENTAENIRTFWFKPEKEMRHVAGQFTELHIPHAEKDKRGDKRWFTLSNSPTQPMLSITTKFASDQGSSFKKALAELKPGAELNMASPMGDFILPKDAAIPLIFVAGGIGCTPFHSIIQYLQDTGEDRDITMLYAANDDAQIAFKDTFQKLGPNFIAIVGERLTAARILEISKNKTDPYIYVSGPEPMVESLADGLKSSGFNKKRIHTDFFPNYTTI